MEADVPLCAEKCIVVVSHVVWFVFSPHRHEQCVLLALSSTSSTAPMIERTSAILAQAMRPRVVFLPIRTRPDRL